MPGYPAFLAIVYALTGHTGEAARRAVLSHAGLCGFIQLRPDRRIAALLASLCTEKPTLGAHFSSASGSLHFVLHRQLRRRSLDRVWAIFLTTLASLFLVAVIASAAGVASLGQWPVTGSNYWLLLRLPVLSLASALFFRPEAAAPSLNRVPRPGRHSSAPGRNQALGGSPWHSWVLEPRCPSFPGSSAMPEPSTNFNRSLPRTPTLPRTRPQRLHGLERTWLYRVRDCYLVSWKLNDEEMRLSDMPGNAFDTPEERMVCCRP